MIDTKSKEARELLQKVVDKGFEVTYNDFNSIMGYDYNCFMLNDLIVWFCDITKSGDTLLFKDFNGKVLATLKL